MNEALRQKLFEDDTDFDAKRLADRLEDLPPVQWSDATELILSELDKGQQDKLVNELESRAQRAARQASYLYMRIGSTTSDRGHSEAVKRQNTVGRKLHTAFGYDGRSLGSYRF